MARIRTVKPEFWTSAQVMECSPMARLLFIGMWNFADDAGRMAYSPKTLKAQIYPSDDITVDDVARLVAELSTNFLIFIYNIENKDYLQVTGWTHQKIDKPKASKLPAPVVDTSTTHRRAVATDLILSTPIVSKDSSRVATATPTPVKTYSKEFEDRFWIPYPRTPTMSKKDAWKAWQKLSPDKREDACKAIGPYKASMRGKEQYIVHAVRFLSQERFEGFIANGTTIAPVFDIRAHLS